MALMKHIKLANSIAYIIQDHAALEAYIGFPI